MLTLSKYPQETSQNQQVLFLPLTDIQILAIEGCYQDSLPIKITGIASNQTAQKSRKP
ncbi:MAG: hypothetical protein WA919_23220 [Coleofasciculaceae cyanobacterium]